MEQVRLDRKWLLAKVKANQAKHKADYAKAWEGYKQEMLEALEAAKSTLEKGEVPRIMLSAPQDQSEDYETAIWMLEHSVDNEIVLHEHTFRQWVMDNWEWKHHWAVANSRYLDKFGVK